MPRKAAAAKTTSHAMWFEDQPEAPAAQPQQPVDKDAEKDMPCGCKCPCNCRVPYRQYTRDRRRICGMCEEGIHGTGILRKKGAIDDIPTSGGYGVPGSKR